MKVAIFGKHITQDSRNYLESLYEKLDHAGIKLCINTEFDDFMQNQCDMNLGFETYKDHKAFAACKPDLLLTVGGDGTLLDSTTYVRDSGVPILGINTGRLGFLANVAKDEVVQAADAIINEKYTIDYRSLISVNTNTETQPHPNFALNEVTVSRKDTTTMITIHVWIDGEYLNSYWADGLMLATPTGSTGYSLSCGGPIVMPGSENFIITPVAPHNLTVRPFVIPNNVHVKFKVEVREDEFLLSLDSRILTMANKSEVEMCCSPFQIKLVETHFQNFASTLRNKLLWGLDRRN